MTALLDRLAERIGEGLRGPQAPPASAGAVLVPEQIAEFTGLEALLSPGMPFELIFSPGVTQKPVWGRDVWELSGFQAQLSGIVSLNDASAGEALIAAPLPVTLILRNDDVQVWSQNLALDLVAVPGSGGLEFKFSIGVFVDLVNPVPYMGATTLTFAITGIVPSLK